MYTHLTQDERYQIAAGIGAGASLRAIAGQLGRSPATISREVARNSTNTGYKGLLQRQSQARARKSQSRIRIHANSWKAICHLIQLDWSPEQISRMLPRLFPGRPEMRAAPETIYQALYAGGPDRLQRDGVRPLRTGRVHRKRRRRSGERQ